MGFLAALLQGWRCCGIFSGIVARGDVVVGFLAALLQGATLLGERATDPPVGRAGDGRPYGTHIVGATVPCPSDRRVGRPFSKNRPFNKNPPI